MTETLAGRIAWRVRLLSPDAAEETLFAELRPLPAALPRVDGDAVAHRPRWRVTLRRVPGLTLAHRLRFRDAELRLLGIEDDPAKPDRLTLVAEEAP